jgi:hypothetical protein
MYHKHPKGCPPKEGVTHKLLTEVNAAMTLCLSQNMLGDQAEDLDDSNLPEEDDIGTLENIHNVSSELDDIPQESFSCATILAPEEPASNHLDVLTRDCLHHHRILKQLNLNTEKILLGAAWMTDTDWRNFMRFPEVIFIDTTHQKNSDGRPLLLVCGKDSNGKVFVAVYIFVPNETASFYRWVFLNCLPSLLVMITDGDSQEFNAVDESIFAFFTRAIWILCAFHLVEKTYEKDGPFHQDYLDSSRAYSLVTAIKCWVYSWMRGESCLTEDEHELSNTATLGNIDR